MILIENGTLVSPRESFLGDILVEGLVSPRESFLGDILV